MSFAQLQNYLWKTLYFMSALAVFSLFASKSGLELSARLMIVISVFLIPWKSILNHKWLVAYFSSFGILVIVSSLSMGGGAVVKEVFIHNPWFLIVLPGYALFLKPPAKIKFIENMYLAGIFAGCVYSLWKWGLIVLSSEPLSTRIDSFWDVSRWGIYCWLAMMVSTMAAAYYKSKKDQQKKYFYLHSLIAGLSVICLVLSGARAPWIASVFSMVALAIITPNLRKVMSYLLVFFIGVVLLIAGPERLQSIVAVKKDSSGKVTSDNASNAGRLHMWVVAFDFMKEQPFFGTGFGQVEKPLRSFLDRQGDEYKSKYITSEFSYNDQHSSLIGSAVQYGIIYALLFWVIVFSVMIQSTLLLFKLGALTKAVWVTCVGYMAIFFFYTAIFSYEALPFYLGILFLLLETQAFKKRLVLL